MVSLSPNVVAWFVCLTHGLLHPGIAALPLSVLQGLTPLIVLPAALPYPERKNKLHLEGVLGWLTRSTGISAAQLTLDPARPPTNPCCCISLDQFPREGRLVERWLFVQSSHAHSLGTHKMYKLLKFVHVTHVY